MQAEPNFGTPQVVDGALAMVTAMIALPAKIIAALAQKAWDGLSAVGGWIADHVIGGIPGALTALALLPGKILKALGEKAWDGLSAVGGFIKDAIVGGIGGIGSAVKSMIVDAINDAIDLLNKLIGAYNAIPILGDIGKVGHIGGGGSGTAPGLGKFVAMRAAGGPVTAGRPYVVGEEGRELFVPGRSGRIIPNGALALAGGGGGVVNNYFSFPNYVGDKDELMRVVRQEAHRYKMRDGNSGLA